MLVNCDTICNARNRDFPWVVEVSSCKTIFLRPCLRECDATCNMQRATQERCWFEGFKEFNLWLEEKLRKIKREQDEKSYDFLQRASRGQRFRKGALRNLCTAPCWRNPSTHVLVLHVVLHSCRHGLSLSLTFGWTTSVITIVLDVARQGALSCELYAIFLSLSDT